MIGAGFEKRPHEVDPPSRIQACAEISPQEAK